MKILVINSGSSSLKYQLFDMDQKCVLAKGGCEKIGEKEEGIITHKVPGRTPYVYNPVLETHDKALSEVFNLLTDDVHGVLKNINEIDAVGHRVAHGGEKLKKSTKVTQDVIDYLESIIPINPLHGPAAVKGMKACLELLKDIPQVAVFDTSFYANFKPENYLYAIPYEYYTNDAVRRYGFHGTSHRYVTKKVSELMNKPYDELKIITCHLGNGSSITATNLGTAIDTTMGFTPQEGIPMGTRSGSIDPTIIPYLMKKYNLSPDEMTNILNKQSGLLAISGFTNDFRNLAIASNEGNVRAKLAIDMLALSIKKYIGSFTAEMNGLDALVFTAGIGENNALIRKLICQNLTYLGIEIDDEVNENSKSGTNLNITGKNSKVQVWVIPTDEEYMIALDTQELVK